MDPLTQALLGSVAAHGALGKRLGRPALLLGAVGGELPDIDVVFGPWTDPALPFELHRHWTHALVAVPLVGLVAALPFLLLPWYRARFGLVVGATTIGAATHGLLDNCTSYGTHLLWPFVAERTAWDVLSIIDPIFTLLLALGVAVACITRGARPAVAALALALVYAGFGTVQHHRAAGAQREIASSRGHVIETGRVMPTLGNALLWRSVYVHDGRIHADAVHVAPFGGVRVAVGTSIARFTDADLPVGGADPERVRDAFRRFEAFATGFTAAVERADDGSVAIGDVRYSYVAGAFRPIWGLAVVPRAVGDPVQSIGFPMDRADALGAMFRSIVDPGPEFVPVESAANPDGRDR